MISQACLGLAEVSRQRAGAQVAGWANFQSNGPLREHRHDLPISRCCNAVADALSSQNIHGVAYRLRRANFSSVNQPMQAACTGVLIYIAKFRCRAREFIAAHSKGHHAVVALPHSALGDLACGSRSKLAHRVEDPLQTQAARLVWRRGFADSP